MRSIQRKLAVAKGMTKFLFTPTFTFQKLSHFPKYTEVYSNMYDKRQERKKNEIEQFLKEERQRRDKESILNRTLLWKKSFIQKVNLVKLKQNDQLSSLKTTNFQQTFKHYGNKGFEYLALYYESLQALIEGRREVLHNENFKFDDGLSVKQKQEKVEKFLNKMMGKSLTKNQP